MADTRKLDRLINQLTTSPTAKQDQALWQVIIQLIASLKELQAAVASSSGSSGSSVTNNINQINQFLSFEDSVNPDDSAVFAGISASGGSTTSGDDYVVLSDGVTPTPSPVNDGAGNFIYVAYTP